MRSILTLALGFSLAYPTIVDAAPRRITVHPECTRDRCVYYHGSQRVFSVEKEDNTDRLVIRDNHREVVAKVKRQDDGTVEIKKPYRRR